MNLLDKISYSNTTLIGYDTQNEHLVKKLLQFLPSVILFERASSDKEVMEHFNSVSHFRDYKLSSILDNNKTNYVVVDLSTLFFEEESKDSNELFSGITRRKFIQELQSRLYTLSDSSIKFKLVLLSNIYITMTPLNTQVFFRGGSTIVNVVDLVVKFLGDKLMVEKDRNTSTVYTQNVKEELREISIKSLFDELTATT